MDNRRVKFDKFLQDAFLELIRQGIGITNACAKVGIARSTLSRHREINKKFAAAIHEAEMDANELVEMALFRTAIGGNVTAQQVWLYNRDPERWQDRRNVTVSGDKNSPLEINLSGEELDAEIKRLVDIANKAIAPVIGGESKK